MDIQSRKIDMLNADLALSNDASAKKSRKKNNSLRIAEEEQDQAGFHFIAFVPIQGSVWKLDGLERQPMNLGRYFDLSATRLFFQLMWGRKFRSRLDGLGPSSD
jgi:hypothetical protein